MPEPLSIECPNCGVRLKLKDRSKVGKKVPCPKCKKPFVVELPEDDLDFFDELPPEADSAEDEFGDEFGDDEFAPPPSHARRRAEASRGGKRRPTRSANSGGGKTALLVGAGVIVVLMLVGIGLWAAGVFSSADEPLPLAEQVAQADGGGPNGPQAAEAEQGAAPEQAQSEAPAAEPLELAWLPPDIEMVVSIRPADIWNSPLVQSFADAPGFEQFADQMVLKTGHHPSDFESVVVGISKLEELSEKANPAVLGAAGPPSPPGIDFDNALVVIRSSVALDQQKLANVGAEAEQAQYKGTSYYRTKQQAGQTEAGTARPPVAILFPDSTTAVIGPEELVKAAIDQGPNASPRPELHFAHRKQQLYIAVAPKDPSVFTSGMPQADTTESQAARQLQEALQTGGLTGVSLAVRVAGGVDLDVAVNCADAASAEKIRTAMEALLAEGRDSWEQNKGRVPPVLASLLDGLIKGMKTSAGGQVASVSVSVSESMVEDIKKAAPQLAQMAAPLMMMAAMAGAAGGGMPAGPLASPGFGDTPAPPAYDLPTEAPKDLQVSGVARWSQMQLTVGGQKQPPILELWVYVVGQQAQSAIAWGKPKLIEAVSDAGKPLRLVPQAGFHQSASGFQKIERTFGGHPRFGVRATLPLTHPGGKIGALGRVRGSVTLLAAEEKKEVVVDNIGRFAGKTIDHPDLKAAGVEVTVKRQQNQGWVLSMPANQADLVADIVPVDASGKKLDSVAAFQQSFRNQVSHTLLYQGGSGPQNARIKLTLNVGLHEVEVPFDFKDVRVPLEPDDPGQPPVDTKAIPQGLTLAAKARWPNYRMTDARGNPIPPPLEVELNVGGPKGKQVIGWQIAKVDQAVAEGNVPLQYSGAVFSGPSGQRFQPIDRSHPGAAHPADGARAVVVLSHPPKPVTSIQTIKGLLRLQTAGRTAEVRINNVPSLLGKPLNHPELRKAGLRLKFEKGPIGYRLAIAGGDAGRLGAVVAVDSGGKKLERVFISRVGFGNEVYYQINTFNDLPADTGLNLTVYHDVSVLNVPFRFDGISVPDPPVW